MAKKKKRLTPVEKIWASLRISLGLIFLWAFVDKVFGLGFATAAEDAWIAGGSPTLGFLSFATTGPFAGFYQSIAGNPFVDWLFMRGLLGIGVRLACYSGALMLFLMWTAVLTPEHHPFLDDHIVYGLLLIGLYHVKAGRWWGLGHWCENTSLGKKHPWLT